MAECITGTIDLFQILIIRRIILEKSQFQSPDQSLRNIRWSLSNYWKYSQKYSFEPSISIDWNPLKIKKNYLWFYYKILENDSQDKHPNDWSGGKHHSLYINQTLWTLSQTICYQSLLYEISVILKHSFSL